MREILADLFTTCTITTPTGRTITLAEIIRRSISPAAPLCKPTYRMGGKNSPWYVFTHCQTGDCSGFIIKGICPEDDRSREVERLALFIGNIQNILLGYRIDLLGMGRIILSRGKSEALREEILARSREKYFPLECEAYLFSPDES